MESTSEYQQLYLCSVKRVDTGLPEKEVSLDTIITKNPKEASKELIQDVFEGLWDDPEEPELNEKLHVLKKSLDTKIDMAIDNLKDSKKTPWIGYGAVITGEDGEENLHSYDSYFGDIVFPLYHGGIMSYVLEIYKVKLGKRLHICIYEH